jgi:hypothetical protein
VIRRLPTHRALLRARAVLAALGLILSMPALLVAVSLGTGGPLDPIGSQTRDVARGLDQLDGALSRIETSLTAAGATLEDGRRVSTDASDMTTALATAMSELSLAASAQVLGVQPFAALAPRFSELATRSHGVASSLTSTASSLGTTRTELSGLQTDVGDLRDTVRRLGAGSAQRDGIGGPSLLATRLLLVLLVAWFATSSGLALLVAARELNEPVQGSS